jgi:hypothetical protein
LSEFGRYPCAEKVLARVEMDDAVDSKLHIIENTMTASFPLLLKTICHP